MGKYIRNRFMKLSEEEKKMVLNIYKQDISFYKSIGVEYTTDMLMNTLNNSIDVINRLN